MYYMVYTNLNGTLSNYYENFTQKLQWNFACIENGRVVHYSDIVWIHDINARLDIMENNLQKQKGHQN